MKAILCATAVSLLLISCVGKKDLAINTYPEGAEITINGEVVGTTPLVTTVAQDKTLGIVARKPGYQIGVETISPVRSKFLSFIWTENDPKAKYIEEDSVEIPLEKFPEPKSYKPTQLPKYTGGGGSTSAALPEVPALRPIPELD
jgi:hypothetical protein